MRLTLRDAKTRKLVLPVFYNYNYFSLLPGESRNFRIQTRAGAPSAVDVALGGWNIKPVTLM